MDPEIVLDVEGLTVEYPTTHDGWRPVVEGVTFAVRAGERVALVGESGSGKSVTALACLGLVHAPGRRSAGRVRVAGVDLGKAAVSELQRIRGGVAGIVFQEPASCLNPVYTIGFQLSETIRSHHRMNGREARAFGRRLLSEVSLEDSDRIAASYPHQLSGGQLQRALIALALAGDPRLLIADEPTSALDLLTQAEILGLLARLTGDKGIALLLVSHDLAVVQGNADRVVVMYAGRVVEVGATSQLFAAPLHPYTRALLAAAYREAIEGASCAGGPPAAGCRYAPRCSLVQPSCRRHEPELAAVGGDRWLRCPVISPRPDAEREGG